MAIRTAASAAFGGFFPAWLACSCRDREGALSGAFLVLFVRQMFSCASLSDFSAALDA